MASISRTPSIYQIRHLASGKVYVGSAVNPSKRQREHYRLLRKGAHGSRHLQNAWVKYGEAAFVFEIIESVLFVELLIEREQYWIDALRAFNRTHGYNISPTAGSPLGVKQTDEARAKMTEHTKALWRDPAHRAKITEHTKARWEDPAYRAKMTEQSRAYYADPAHRAEQSNLMRERLADPAEYARKSKLAKARWEDPAYRARMSEQATTNSTNPVQRARVSAQSKTRWADPEYRVKMSAKRKAMWEDPTYRANRKKDVAIMKRILTTAAVWSVYGLAGVVWALFWYSVACIVWYVLTLK